MKGLSLIDPSGTQGLAEGYYIFQLSLSPTANGNVVTGPEPQMVQYRQRGRLGEEPPTSPGVYRMPQLLLRPVTEDVIPGPEHQNPPRPRSDGGGNCLGPLARMKAVHMDPEAECTWRVNTTDS